MRGGTLVREARRRAGMTQAELAQRAGTTQSAIARLEANTIAPSLESVTNLVRACGFDLAVHFGRVDPDEWRQAVRNLRLSPERRARNMVAAARLVLEGREARARRRRRG
jgi:transcriptional regulator with XRE-family HTH domain